MKRITLTLSLLLLALGVTTSCQDVTEVTEVYTTPARTIFYTVSSNTWQQYDNYSAYYRVLDVPELTSGFNDIGGVLVYISREVGLFEAIPMTFDNLAYSFSTVPGKVRVDVQSVNGAQINRPVNMEIKILLIDAEDISFLKSKNVDLKNYNSVQNALKSGKLNSVLLD